jgi:hypothetical protein
VRRFGLERTDQLIGTAITEVVLDVKTARCLVLSLIRSGYRYSTIEVTAVDRHGMCHHYLHSHWGIVENGKLQRV